jgi:hypothetical protein
LIGVSNSEVVQSVRRDGSAVTAVGSGCSIFGALPGKDSLQAHKASNAIAPPRAPQHPCQPRAAISLATAGEFPSDAFAQADVLQLARSGLSAPFFPVVITAARDQKRLAQPGYFVLAAHLFDSGIPLGGASERMPRDFFKTSRCSKSLAFSWASVGSRPPVPRTCASPWGSIWPHWVRAPSAPNDKAVAHGYPTRPLPSLHCVRCYATTPTPPVCIDRYSSLDRESGLLNCDFMWASFGF